MRHEAVSTPSEPLAHQVFLNPHVLDNIFRFMEPGEGTAVQPLPTQYLLICRDVFEVAAMRRWRIVEPRALHFLEEARCPHGRRRQYLSYVNTLVFRRRQIPTRREIADLRQEYPNLSTIQFSWFRFNNQMLSMDTFEGCEVRLYGRAVAPEGEGAEEEVVGGLVFMCYQDALAILLEREIGLFGPEKRFKLESLCLRDTRYAPRDPLRIEWEALSEQQQSDIKSVLQDVVTLRLPRLPVDTILLSLLPLFPNLLTLSIYWSAPVESEGALAYNLGMLEAFKKYKHESGVKLSTLAVQLPYGFNGGDEISKRLDRGISLVDK